MPPVIPSPIQAGGGVRQDPIQALLLGLLSSAANYGLQRGFQKAFPEPGLTPSTPEEDLQRSVAGRERLAQESIAGEQLQQMEGAPATVPGAFSFQNLREKGTVGAREEVAAARFQAPERVAVLAEQQRRLVQQNTLAAMRDSLIVQRDAASAALDPADPAVAELNARIQRLDGAVALGAADTAEGRRDIYNNILAPSAETLLSDRTNRIALRALASGASAEELFEAAPSSIEAATIIDTLGLTSMYNQVVSGEQAVDRMFTQESLRLQQELGLQGVPVTEIRRWLVSGEASGRFSEELDAVRASVELSRSVARLGMLERALELPAAQLHTQRLGELFEANDSDGVLAEYNALKGTLLASGVPPAILDTYWPTMKVEEVQAELPALLASIGRLGRPGQQFAAWLQKLGAGVGWGIDESITLTPDKSASTAATVLALPVVNGDYEAAVRLLQTLQANALDALAGTSGPITPETSAQVQAVRSNLRDIEAAIELLRREGP